MEPSDSDKVTWEFMVMCRPDHDPGYYPSRFQGLWGIEKALRTFLVV